MSPHRGKTLWGFAGRGRPKPTIDMTQCNTRRRTNSAAANASEYAVEHALVVVVLPGAPGVEAVADEAKHHLHHLEQQQ